MARHSSEQNKERGKEREEAQQLAERLISVRRVTKVVKGGKTMRFSALVVVGDGKGQVGYGSGKAREVPEAVRKASDKAKRDMIRVPLREGRTVHHDVRYREGAGQVLVRSAVVGTGVIAGGPMRAIFEAVGIQDIVAKSFGTSNDHNVVRATFGALRQITSPRHVATRLGKKLGDIVSRRDALLGKKKTEHEIAEVKN
ncbi:30S ribosomal protein S5 [Alphaproteobacteria bacterium]|nr:30S ribosomal protein S5 [Alphaproteobacteria bacterium]GHS95634.1 30S ribosomal protein S5 [Alphaproteobacteria bacterium]